jgi:hypothetical protein
MENGPLAVIRVLFSRSDETINTESAWYGRSWLLTEASGALVMHAVSAFGIGFSASNAVRPERETDAKAISQMAVRHFS